MDSVIQITEPDIPPTVLQHQHQHPLSPLSPPPPTSTDPAKIQALWARVQMGKQKDESQCTTSTPNTAAKMTAELASRHISIVEGSADAGRRCLPHETPLKRWPLRAPKADLINMQEWAVHYLPFSHPAVSEFQWTADVYLRFLRRPEKPPRRDRVEAQRQLQPYISLKPDNYVLLPPKDMSVLDDHSSQQAVPKKPKKKRVSELPDILNPDEEGERDGKLTETGTNREEQLSTMAGTKQQAIRPDILYAFPLGALKQSFSYIKYPAIRTLASLQLLPPFLIGEFRNTPSQENEARHSLALLGSMLLLERVKLRAQSAAPNLDDLKLYALTCCGYMVTLYCILIPTAEVHAEELLSYEMVRCSAYDLGNPEDAVSMAEALDCIQWWGQKVHLESIKEDVQKVAVKSSFAYVDKHSYQYQDMTSKFDCGDDLITDTEI